jgi:hypothetical protein
MDAMSGEVASLGTCDAPQFGQKALPSSIGLPHDWQFMAISQAVEKGAYLKE